MSLELETNSIFASIITSIITSIIATICSLRISRSEIIFARWHNERSNAIKRIYLSLSELDFYLNQAVSIIQRSDKQEIDNYKKTYPVLNTAYQKALHISANNSIFLEEELNKKIKKIIGDCSVAICHYELYLNGLEHEQRDASTKEYDTANEMVVVIEKLLKEIQESFRDSLKMDV